MSRFIIRFTPMEPYFFGNDRTLFYPGSKGNYSGSLYYVRGEDTPLQTSLLGTLRFLLLQKNGRSKSDFGPLTEEEVKLVGKESFQDPLTREEKYPADEQHFQPAQDFGVIINLSPLFLIDRQDRRYIPIPLDHNAASGKDTYSPFRDYLHIQTMDGDRIFTNEYDVKKGLPSGWLCLEDGTIRNDLFDSAARVGINRRQNEDGFFKKSYKRLKEGFSFAIFAELRDDCIIKNGDRYVAQMGQGSSVFSVQFEQVASSVQTIGQEVKDVLKKYRQDITISRSGDLCDMGAMIYCLGDAFMSTGSGQIEGNIYDGLLFAVTGTRDYRSLYTESTANGLSRAKRERMYHLLRAGSVMIASDQTAAAEWVRRWTNENAYKIGFQTFIVC